MADRKEEKFRKIRKNHTGLSIVFLILFAIIAHILLLLLTVAFFLHIIDSKLEGEYQTVRYMARLYESIVVNNSDEDSKASAYRLLDEEGGDYFITDRTGAILHSRGENTCKMDMGTMEFPGVSKDLIIYPDSKNGFLMPDGEGGLTLEIPDLKIWLGLAGRDFVRIMGEDWQRIFGVRNEETLEELAAEKANMDLPFWVGTEMLEGNSRLISKAVLHINSRDLLLLLVFFFSVGLVIFVITVVMIVTMISGVVRRHKLTSIFLTDDVTGSHNWMWFLIRGGILMKRFRNSGKSFAVIDLVMVNYRNFCVCHSIAEGEALLREVDRLTNENLGRKELCAHYASANFVMLLEFRSEEILNRRLEELTGILDGIDLSHRLNFHIGVDIIRPQNRRNRKNGPVDLELSYNNACAARATLAGRDDSGIAYFNESLVEEQRWRDIVQEHQQQALDNEEFQVYYQPKYDPRTERLKGAEALIRWVSPEFGFISPGKFIPIFEKNGFITHIDHYMIAHVARDQRRWLDAGFRCVPVSVNVSRAHFIESDLAEQVRDMVDAAGTPHEYIEIELTESAFFDDKAAMISTIGKLKSYGFEVSMDDFGAGYSSLNSLKDMPLDVLKLDAEFFRSENSGDERAKIVVSEAVRLAKQLNMRTVAEGVEARDQVDFLAEQGCDMIQGFIFDKPMPGNEFVMRMQSDNKKEVEDADQRTSISDPEGTGDVPEDVQSENGDPAEHNQ
ncbi:MAG: GGDEF domain-containing phosphodiesterase [Lachnospiraceae bacterium]|nr:GGDEF domain-containing phosphodiesterase [Lachnospiraceae bacterium]